MKVRNQSMHVQNTYGMVKNLRGSLAQSGSFGNTYAEIDTNNESS